ncbi:DUF2577 family protein [Bacillus massiliigorillae]|uniref:DUF2577 family protein n=1 Tax=Bacillus massiliigorillae TaxID=1243664 RepID=UPI00039DDBBA|nr:DUF2577 family protein [Bacillus massiliigorillae]
MDKRSTIEGSPAAKMVQLMKKHGFNKEMSIETATVVSPLPNLSLHLESDGILLDCDDLIIADDLTDHTRFIEPIIIGNTTISQVTFKSCLKAGDKVTVIGDNDTQYYYVINKVGD